jgi:aspartyl-tRNA synthetase
VQERVFELLGIGREEAKAKFGFLLEALEYGAPPHGGMAVGLDRIAMLFSGAQSLREVIAFPKTTSASALLEGAPSRVGEQELADLHLRLADSGGPA